MLLAHTVGLPGSHLPRSLRPHKRCDDDPHPPGHPHHLTLFSLIGRRLLWAFACQLAPCDHSNCRTPSRQTKSRGGEQACSLYLELARVPDASPKHFPVERQITIAELPAGRAVCFFRPPRWQNGTPWLMLCPGSSFAPRGIAASSGCLEAKNIGETPREPSGLESCPKREVGRHGLAGPALILR